MEREKEGELATMSLEFEFHLQFPCGSLSTELSDFRQSTRSRNERKCKRTLKNTCKVNDVTTNVISANQHLASTFLMQIVKFQRRTCKLSFLFPPRRQSTPESMLASTFLMQIVKFQRRTCKLSFLFPPRRQSTPESMLEDHVRHGDSDNENENESENEE